MAILNQMVQGYITAMLWSSSGTDQEGEDLESLEGFELSLETQIIAERDCFAFMQKNMELILTVIDHSYTFDNVGHDFWLTRNGHGAGFWDRGFGLVGDQLTEAAEEFGQQNPYIGDDGKIYF